MNISIKNTHQEAQGTVKKRDILHFCALTPYKYTRSLCATCKCAQSEVRWIQLYVDDTLVGLAVCQYEQERRQEGCLCILQHLIISPSFQRKGLGTMLLKHIIHEGIPIMLSVDGTQHVIDFYKKHGFEPVESLPILMCTTSIPPREALIISLEYSMF